MLKTMRVSAPRRSVRMGFWIFELDAVQKFKVGETAKGNVAAKRGAVATLVGVAPAVKDGDDEDDDDDDDDEDDDGRAGVAEM
jgi:hypothetical protein